MTHTLRKYNKSPIIGGPGFCGWIRSNKLTGRDISACGWPWYDNFGPWIGYHPWRQYSRMRGWKDYRLDVRRRQNKNREVKQRFYFEEFDWMDDDFI